MRGRSFFVGRGCRPSARESRLDFLSQDFRQRFGRHPFLGRCYCLFLAGAAEREDHQRDSFSALYQNEVIPRRVTSGRTTTGFVRTIKRFREVVGSDNFIALAQLTTSRVAKRSKGTNVVRGCFSLSRASAAYLGSVKLCPRRVHIKSGVLYLRALSSIRSLPKGIKASYQFRGLSASQDSYQLSFTTPINILLSYGRICGRFVFVSSRTRGLGGFRRATQGVRSLSHCSHTGRIGGR